MSAHEHSFTKIDGGPLPLNAFRGKPVLVVNTASECGFTPQYKGLEALWRRFGPKGLVVLGVPSNDFGAQEPGTEAQIRDFCERNYQVSFPMTAKVKTIGGDAHPFYKWVIAELGEDAAPRWNFHKYLIDGEGNLAEAWPSKIEPGSKTVADAVYRRLPVRP
ncbi:MAG: glutathione peroxidase [Alphaproteobacteria bacterium]